MRFFGHVLLYQEFEGVPPDSTDFPLKCYDIPAASHEELINATLSPTVVTYNSTISAFGTSARWEV